jgi:2'-5' RNA ligase
MSRTLLAVLVPDAESIVGDLRARLDPSARLGLGAHFTVLYPFFDSGDLVPEHLQRLDKVAAGQAACTVRMARVGCFPSTVWLGPEPAEPLVALAAALEAAFPERPRQGRVHGAFVPHLSVARNVRTAGDRDAVVAALHERLPAGGVPCRCEAVHVMVRQPRGWQPLHRSPLGH